VNGSRVLPLIVLCSPLLTGCLATTQEIEDLRVDIAHLQQSLSKEETHQGEYLASLQANQADALSQTTALSSRLEALSARLEESDAKMADLAVKLDDLDKNLSNRMDLLTEGVGSAKKAAAVAPSRLFQLAYTDYMKRRYSQALNGFQDYLAVYGEGPQAAEAQFYVGECRFARKEWKKALASYEVAISSFPTAAIVPSAYLQSGVTLERLGQRDAAVETFETLVKKYPGKPEAETAKARLDSLRKAQNRPASSGAPAAAPAPKPAEESPDLPAPSPAPAPRKAPSRRSAPKPLN